MARSCPAISPPTLARAVGGAAAASVGAAQAWTKRLVDRFGPLPPGTVAEDLVMVFRALGSGGAITLREPLVQYRRGGISRRRRKLYASDVIERLLKNNRHALVETEQMLKDARLMGRYDEIGTHLERTLARERFIAALFGAGSAFEKLGIALRRRAAARAAPALADLRGGALAAGALLRAQAAGRQGTRLSVQPSACAAGS